jgi:hypothetical protein
MINYVISRQALSRLLLLLSFLLLRRRRDVTENYEISPRQPPRCAVSYGVYFYILLLLTLISCEKCWQLLQACL